MSALSARSISQVRNNTAALPAAHERSLGPAVHLHDGLYGMNAK